MRKYFFGILLLASISSIAQKKKSSSTISSNIDSALYSKLQYRLIGPFRGGRSAAVAGSYKDKNVFYMGSTGGGIWKTSDAGGNWKNISDKYFGGTMGAVAVAPSDDQVIYVGEGENTMRGNVSEGLGGMWRSDDAGRSWKNIGLKDGRHITRIVIHPRNPDIAWVAIMGHLFGPNNERGIYKTIDGGKNWKRVLFVNEQTGASDLVMEPGNAMVLYAGTWRVIRTPYSLESGGSGSGLYKSTDGGETWKNISGSKGLPKGTWGITAIAVAPSNPDKLYSIIEHNEGGLFTSNDAGETWTLASSDNNIRQRAWYYTKIFIDPKNENLIYAPNVGLMKSSNGGKTWQELGTPHGDHHDLWIDPENGNRMIVADDGGGQVSMDGGNTWSTYNNQPTSQLYRLSTDNAFPYRVLAAQQDNSTFRIRSRTYGDQVTDRDWEPTAGAESGYVVADPLNPDVVYGGNYGGYLSRLDHKTGENRAISVWPDNPLGAGADSLKYRFQWNFPIFFSPHNPKRLYAAGNVLFVSEDQGHSWEAISKDLTTNDKSRQVSSGGPITKDNTSVEYYCTIFTATESSLEKDLLWTGSDDGLIHVSRDAGKNWENVTPKDLPKWMMWNCVEVDPFKKGTAYFAGTRYKLDDFSPYIYKTEDYGKTWKRIIDGIPSMHFTRTMRADKKKPGLLYAGTEYGMYISYNDGVSWKPFQLNLPIVPITDLLIRNNDLIVATQGRAIYILDDLARVQEANSELVSQNLHAYTIDTAYRMEGSQAAMPVNAGKNPKIGVIINFLANNIIDSTKGSIQFFDSTGKSIRVFSTDSTKNKLELVKGYNQFVWDLKYPEGEKVDGMILWSGVPGNILAVPGNYKVKLKVGKDSTTMPFSIVADPNYKTTQAEYVEQFTFLNTVSNKFNEVQKTVRDIRATRNQLNDFLARQAKDSSKEIKARVDSINNQMTAIEEQLYQTKAKSSQDVLNYPIRLNDKIGNVFNTANSGNFPPSKQVKEVFADLSAQADKYINRYHKIRDEQIPAFNKLIHEKALPVIRVVTD
jgi:photosystem II stability/assembly factor-like uncharacterized protein